MPIAQVDCGSIPRKLYSGRECCDWEKSVGLKLPFCCGGERGELEILAAEKCGRSCYVTVRYRDKSHRLLSSSLTAGHIGPCIGGRSLQYKLVPGQRLQDENRDITILSEFKGNVECSPYQLKMLTFQCNRCGFRNQGIREGEIVRGRGCPVCNGKIAVPGVNDIASREPWMIPYFPGGENQAKTFTCSSGRRLRLKCPHCGRLSDHPITIATLRRTRSIVCPCGDGVSLPEKFVFCLFQTVGISYTRQVSAKDFPWCGKYRNDGMFFIL